MQETLVKMTVPESKPLNVSPSKRRKRALKKQRIDPLVSQQASEAMRKMLGRQSPEAFAKKLREQWKRF